MSRIKIEHLKDHPEYLSTVATWIYNEWWKEEPKVSVKSMRGRLEEAKTDCEIPLSLLALVDCEPAGTVNFIESDNSEFPELKPWLAALLVSPKFRRLGVGSALVNECIRYAKKLEINEFYLGTEIPEFYEKFGAEIYTIGSKNLRIMKVKI